MAKATGSKASNRAARGSVAIPKWHENGKYIPGLTAVNFPGSIEGKLAHAQYSVLKWQARVEELKNWSDPAAKKVRKIKALKAKLEKLESAEL